MNKKNNVILLTILLICAEFINSELFYIIIVILTGMSLLKNGVYKKSIKVISPLLIIFFIGFFIGGVWLGIRNYKIRDYIRDIFYFSAPIIFILYGSILYKKNNNKLSLYKSIIYAAIIISLRHCLLIVINFNRIFTGLGSRGIGGLQSSVTVVGIVLVLFLESDELLQIITSKKRIILVKILLIASFILYLSRTDFIILIGFILIYFFMNKNIKFSYVVKVILKLLILAIIIVKFIPDNMINEFMSKTTKIFTEISSSSEKNWNFETINNDWRGYEIYQTKLAIKNGNFVEQSFGFGFGKNINIDSKIYLEGKEYTELAILHNGYYYVMFKCGLIGGILLVLFMLNILIKNIKRMLRYRASFEYKLLVGSTMWMLLSTYVVTGIFNISISFVYMIILGYLNMFCNRKMSN